MAYIGEIRLFAQPFVPVGWLPCDGTLYAVAQYPGLAAVLNYVFGGEPYVSFAVPDLRGRVPLGTGIDTFGLTYTFAQTGGAAAVPLSTTQIPQHGHSFALAVRTGTAPNPTNRYPAGAAANTLVNANPPNIFGAGAPLAISPETIEDTGGNAPHPNIQPSISMLYCIAVAGSVPAKTGEGASWKR